MPSAPVIDSVTVISASRLRITYHNSGTGDHNQLFRSTASEYDGEQVKIADPVTWNTSSGTFDDFAVASAKNYVYQMVGVDSGGATAASTTKSGSAALASAWLHSVTKFNSAQNAVLFMQLIEVPPHARDYALATLARALGNVVAPIIGISSIEETAIQIPIVIPFGSADNRATLRTMFTSRLYLCLRTALGNKWFGRLLPFEEGYGGTHASIAVNFAVLDFKEAV